MNKNPLIKKQEKTLQPNKRKSTRTLRNPDRSSLLISNMQWHGSIHRKLYGHTLIVKETGRAEICSYTFYVWETNPSSNTSSFYSRSKTLYYQTPTVFFFSLLEKMKEKNKERGRGDRHSIDPKPPTGFAQTVLGYVYMKT